MTPTTTGGARRVRIIGAERAASALPPDGFAVTGIVEAELDDDPLESFDKGVLSTCAGHLQTRSTSGHRDAALDRPPDGPGAGGSGTRRARSARWQRAGDAGPVWREHDHDWADPGFEPSMLADEGLRVGELRTHDTSEERRPWDSVGRWRGPTTSGPVTNFRARMKRTSVCSFRCCRAGDHHQLVSTKTRLVRSRLRRIASATGGAGQLWPRPSRCLSRIRQSAVALLTRAGYRPFDPPSDGGSGRNMTLAIATGVAVAAVAVLAMWGGPLPTVILSTAVITLCAAEAYGTLRRTGRRSATLLGIVATAAVVVAASSKGPSAIPLMAVLLLVGTMLWYLIGVEPGSAVDGTSSTVFVFVWVGVLGAFAGLLLAPAQFPDRHGVAFFAGAVIAAVLDDVGALIAGRWFGRHPLAPTVSPKKTWEGLVGGSVLAIVGSAFIVGHIHPWTVPKAALLGVVIAVVAPIGDLCESLIKRDLKLKDMGSVLPGHGGLLDRFDALLFALPATYFLVRLVHLG